MIISDGSRTFNSRASTISCSIFNCIVSTAKNGFFSGQSTLIIGKFLHEKQFKPYGKIVYLNHVPTEKRHEIHGYLVKQINDRGENGEYLHIILDDLFGVIGSQGLLKEMYLGIDGCLTRVKI